MLVVERGDDLVHFPALLGERDAHGAAVDARAGMVKISHLDQLLDVIGNVRAEIVTTRAKLARGQLLVADIVQKQGLHRIDVAAAAAIELILNDVQKPAMQTLDQRQRFKIDRSDIGMAIGAVRRNFDLGYAVHVDPVRLIPPVLPARFCIELYGSPMKTSLSNR